MDLILWRHAQAQEHPDPDRGEQGDASDLLRCLTPRGHKQASRMAAWLDRQLPQGARVCTSPALRTEQTAQALGRPYHRCDELLPGAEPDALLALAHWPHARAPVVLVGHQPSLGRLIAQLLALSVDDWPVKKGAVWWLRHRQRPSGPQTVLVTVQTPEHL